MFKTVWMVAVLGGMATTQTKSLRSVKFAVSTCKGGCQCLFDGSYQIFQRGCFVATNLSCHGKFSTVNFQNYRQNWKKMKIHRILLLLLVCIFNGCGGGGGGSTPTPTFNVSVTTSGLSNGQQVALLLNGGTPLTVSSSGTSTFSASVPQNGTYAVTVGTQPVNEVCTVNNGTGSGVNANITNITVTCSLDTYTISGTVSGLASGQQVTLLNNSANATTVSANGGFTFTVPVSYNGSYAVTVGTQPTAETCTVQNGVGTNITSNVTNVVLNCGVPVSLLILNGQTDSSLGQKTLTFNGNAIKQITTDPWGNQSPVLSFDTSGTSYLTVPFTTAFGLSDFTIDLWFYPTLNNNSWQALLADWNNTAGPFAVLFNSGRPNTNIALSGGSRSIESSFFNYINYNTWNHYAITRNNGVFNYWVNGKLDSSDSTHIGVAVNPASGTLYIGHQEADSYAAYTGYMTAIRILPGKALFSAPFTPPTSLSTYTQIN